MLSLVVDKPSSVVVNSLSPGSVILKSTIFYLNSEYNKSSLSFTIQRNLQNSASSSSISSWFPVVSDSITCILNSNIILFLKIK